MSKLTAGFEEDSEQRNSALKRENARLKIDLTDTDTTIASLRGRMDEATEKLRAKTQAFSSLRKKEQAKPQAKPQATLQAKQQAKPQAKTQAKPQAKTSGAI